jgi:hypothetical protein
LSITGLGVSWKKGFLGLGIKLMKPEDLIIGSFSLPKVSVRPLIPPPPSSNVSFPKAQHLSWQLVKSSLGISSGPLGTFRKPIEHVVREGEQHNLVLDQAYDYIATYGLSHLRTYPLGKLRRLEHGYRPYYVLYHGPHGRV